MVLLEQLSKERFPVLPPNPADIPWTQGSKRALHGRRIDLDDGADTAVGDGVIDGL